MRAVFLPMGFANSTDPCALAFAGHEFGHINKPVIIVVHLLIRNFLAIALIASFVASFFFPIAHIVVGVAVTNALWFCVKISYERRASIDGLAALIERNFIAEENDLALAVQTLQFGLLTYLPIWPQWFFDLRYCIRSCIVDTIGYIRGKSVSPSLMFEILLGDINMPIYLITIPLFVLLKVLAP